MGDSRQLGTSGWQKLVRWFRPPPQESIDVNDTGVLRVHGNVREEVRWEEVTEIGIVTTDEGPSQEDVYFLLIATDRGVAIPHSAAVRNNLLGELQARFPNFDNEAVIAAMGCTSKDRFLLWKKP